MKYSKKEELRPGIKKEQNMNMVKGTARTRAMYEIHGRNTLNSRHGSQETDALGTDTQRSLLSVF